MLSDREALLENGQLIRKQLLDFRAIVAESNDILQELKVSLRSYKTLRRRKRHPDIRPGGVSRPIQLFSKTP